MPIQFPQPLAPGDLIAITAPSAGVAPPMHPRLDLAISTLRQRGYRVIEGACLRQDHKHVSAAPYHRATELMQFLTNPEVAAVMPPWGGELAIELLELIDFAALSGLPAKWFVGFSDLSTLHLPLTTVAGWATVHGPNLMELGATHIDDVTAGVWQVLAASTGSVTTQASSKLFQRKALSWVHTPGADLVLTEDAQWKRLDGSSAGLQVRGRLIGGCLDTVARLAGTPYGDVPGFIKASQGDGTLLYLENVEMQPCEVLRALYSLRLNGWLQGLNAILVGRSAVPVADKPDDLTYVDALRSALAGVPYPVLYDLDIGHLPPQISIVNGALATITYQNGGGTIAQTFSSRGFAEN